MAAVGGDVSGVHTLSRTWGGHAASTSGQAAGFGRALAAIPSGRFSGGKADQARDFAARMQTAAATAAAAYDQVGSMLPRVADAIDEAQRAEQALDRARLRVGTAQRAVGTAELECVTAAAAVAAPQVYGAITALVGGHAGPTPAQLAELASAQRRLRQAQHELADAQRAQSRAQHRFDDADRHRTQQLDAFARLCEQQAALLEQAVPTPPAPATGFESFLNYLIGPSPQGAVLHAEANALRNVPWLTMPLQLGEVTAAQLERALRGQDWQHLVAWTPHFQPLRTAPPTLQPHGGGFWHFVGDVTGFNDAKRAVDDLGHGDIGGFLGHAVLAVPIGPGKVFKGGRIILKIAEDGAEHEAASTATRLGAATVSHAPKPTVVVRGPGGSVIGQLGGPARDLRDTTTALLGDTREQRLKDEIFLDRLRHGIEGSRRTRGKKAAWDLIGDFFGHLHLPPH